MPKKLRGPHPPWIQELIELVESGAFDQPPPARRRKPVTTSKKAAAKKAPAKAAAKAAAKTAAKTAAKKAAARRPSAKAGKKAAAKQPAAKAAAKRVAANKRKPARKPPVVWTGAPSTLWAVKTARCPKYMAWMPDEVAVSLQGHDLPRLLEPIGWTVVADAEHHVWPADRIKANLFRLRLEWESDFGRGWSLKVRPVQRGLLPRSPDGSGKARRCVAVTGTLTRTF